MPWLVGVFGNGPSPRGWGEPRVRYPVSCRRRTIPTRVGRTNPCGLQSPRQSDHPHAGGENEWAVDTANTTTGPSPRGWGEPANAVRRLPPGRTIPTRVGRTGFGFRRRRTRSDHPHAGGENSLTRAPACAVRGPSPRGWGELGDGGRGAGSRRTIPTRVGRTPDGGGRRCQFADHPHAGGENSAMRESRDLSRGPSPRGWGEPVQRAEPVAHMRTIPTRVGRTAWSVPIHARKTDHPHAGGENRSGGCPGYRAGGPSPRGWGERVQMLGLVTSHRTIPTRVGRTAADDRREHRQLDHPHAGGENDSMVAV